MTGPQLLQIFGDRLYRRNLIVLAGDSQPFDFEHTKLILQVSVAAIIAYEPQVVPTVAQMSGHLAGTRGMPRTFARNTVDDFSHSRCIARNSRGRTGEQRRTVGTQMEPRAHWKYYV